MVLPTEEVCPMSGGLESALHFVADLTLGLGEVVYDYLA
jgi:acetoacetate decarboxylase